MSSASERLPLSAALLRSPKEYPLMNNDDAIKLIGLPSNPEHRDAMRSVFEAELVKEAAEEGARTDQMPVRLTRLDRQC